MRCDLIARTGDIGLWRAADRDSRRMVWPLVLIYYVDAVMIAAWCELRDDFRHFRLDRIQDWTLSDDHFTGKGAELLAEWEKTLKDDTVVTRSH